VSGPAPRPALLAARQASHRGAREVLDSLVRRTRVVSDSAQARNPDTAVNPRVAALQVEAVALEWAGQVDSAIVLLRRAAEISEARPYLDVLEGPARAEAGSPRILLGDFLAKAGRDREAEEAYARALALSPGSTQALLGRARALRNLKRSAEANRTIAALRRTLRFADADAPARAGLLSMVR
jgi:tetratricopeptide (TPR) repeat protein